jgi:urease accessory protein
MRTNTTMTTSGALYRLLSWMSPNFPVGAFAYSHGLEYAVETGKVTDRHMLADWIETVLLIGSGRVDGVLFREAHEATENSDWRALNEIAELGAALQPTSEIALESRSQGAAFLTAARNAWPMPAMEHVTHDIVYPVAVGLACAAHGIELPDGLGAYFHGVAGNLVSAGVRLIPLGQTHGQLALAALEPVVAAASAQAMTVPLCDIGSAAPILDLQSMHHETQYSRLFRS